LIPAPLAPRGELSLSPQGERKSAREVSRPLILLGLRQMPLRVGTRTNRHSRVLGKSRSIHTHDRCICDIVGAPVVPVPGLVM
jgi:hypothetical protein